MTVQLPAFDYATPVTLDEAFDLLSEHGADAAIIGGGTDLVPKMKRRQTSPSVLISLARIEELRGIRVDAGGNCVIGGSTTLSEIAGSPVVPSAFATAAESIASPQIRTTATLGGNLCLDTRCNYIDMSALWRTASGHCLKDGGDTCWVAPKGDRCWAINSTDLAPVAIALSASVKLAGPDGERAVKAEDLYRNDGMRHLNKEWNEVLVELTIPRIAGRAVYLKLRRRGAIDFPLLGVACAVHTDEDERCISARIVVGGIAPAPLRATDAEAYLEGRTLTPETIDEAAKMASVPFRAQDNTDMGSRYRKWMISVYIARALTDLAVADG